MIPDVEYTHSFFVPHDESPEQTLLNSTLDPSGLRFLLREAGFRSAADCKEITGLRGIPRRIHIKVWVETPEEP